MTNVSGTPEKVARRKAMFRGAVRALEQQGWEVARIPRGGKSSLRLISKGKDRHRVAIRTSQDQWLAFPRTPDDKGWQTLGEVDYVVAVSVDDREAPRNARVHMIPGDIAREHFDRAYAARNAAGFTIPRGRGIWLSLYDKDNTQPVTLVGAGMGLDFPAFAEFDILGADGAEDVDAAVHDDEEEPDIATPGDAPLSIPEAKRRLAATLGVPEGAIKITIEH